MNCFELSILAPCVTLSVSLTGVAVHVKKRLVFASFADASVRVLNVDKHGSSKVICGNLKRPTALSVDWLHNRIYICDESEVI